MCIDIKGAFNVAKKDFIYKILKDKKVPNNIMQLVVDFINNRTVHPRRGRVRGRSIVRNLITKMGLRMEAAVKIIKTIFIPSLVYKFKV